MWTLCFNGSLRLLDRIALGRCGISSPVLNESFILIRAIDHFFFGGSFKLENRTSFESIGIRLWVVMRQVSWIQIDVEEGSNFLLFWELCGRYLKQFCVNLEREFKLWHLRSVDTGRKLILLFNIALE